MIDLDIRMPLGVIVSCYTNSPAVASLEECSQLSNLFLSGGRLKIAVIRQSSLLGPSLFQCYITDLLLNILRSLVNTYADEITVNWCTPKLLDDQTLAAVLSNLSFSGLLHSVLQEPI